MQKETYDNENIHLEVVRQPACLIELHVKALAPLLEKAKGEAIKSVRKEVSIPGFRKGKAPEETVRKKYSSAIDKEMRRNIGNIGFEEAQKLCPIPFLNQDSKISFDLKELKEDGAELFYSFETTPLLPPIDLGAFEKEPVKRADTGPDKVEEAIRQMRFFFAEWEAVEDRAVQEGDTVTLHLDTLEEGKEPERVFDGVRFEVKKERMADWMRELVRDAKKGDVLEGVSRPDEDATEEEKAEFAPKNVRITLVDVQVAKLPELDDEFAKKVGAADIPNMRESVERQLNHHADQDVQEKERLQVNAFLLKEYQFELPQSLVEAERKHRFNQKMQNKSFQQEWEALSSEEKKEKEQRFLEEADDAVRLFYLSRHIVKEHKIPISHVEVQSKAVEIYRNHGMSPPNVESIPREVLSLAFSQVILSKAQDAFLKKLEKEPELNV